MKDKISLLQWLLGISVALNLVFLVGNTMKAKQPSASAETQAQLDAALKGWKECIDSTAKK